MTLSELLRSSGVGAGEIVASLGSGMVAQPVAGLAGLLRGTGAVLKGKDFGPAARKAIDTTQEALTYQPRTDIGQRGLENVAKGVETVTEPVYEHVIDPVGMVSPAAGAAMAAGLEVVGPKGKPRGIKPQRTDPALLRTDPLSRQGLLPGVEPLTPLEAKQQARAVADATREGASFTDRGVDYTMRPDNGYHLSRAEGDQLRQDGTTARAIDTSGPSRFEPYSVDPEVGNIGRLESKQRGDLPNYTRMADKQEAVRAADDNFRNQRANWGRDEARRQQEIIDELRGRREQFGSAADVRDRAVLEAQILGKKREQLMTNGTGVYRQTPDSSISTPEWGTLEEPTIGRITEQYNDQFADRADRNRQQRDLLVDALREKREFGDFADSLRPQIEPPQWAQNLTRTEPNRAAGADWWNEKLGVKRAPIDPDAMNRDAVAKFLEQARGEEGMFKLGLMPENATSIEDFARIYGERSGKDIEVNRGTGGSLDDYYDSDASIEYIKEPKEHGRGEVMRDRYGDYKQYEKTHDRGDSPMYDEEGNVKKDKIGLDEEGNPIKEKRVATGGEPMRDTYGDQKYAFKKSEGGEPMYDERGNLKKREVENPDYEPPPDPDSDLELRIGNSNIQISDYDGQPSVDALGASRGGSGHGELLYQTLLSDAVRGGYEIAGNSLTGDNAYRLLSNVLSNYARTGKNPRDVRNTSSGSATPARGRAEGPEVWRAEAEEAKARILRRGGDPNRLMFDGENFYIDGKQMEKGEIKSRLEELSPSFKESKVGERSLMRMAIFDWLRRASPEEAKQAATGWNKGNIFTGLGAGAVGLSSMLREDNQQDDAAAY